MFPPGMFSKELDLGIFDKLFKKKPPKIPERRIPIQKTVKDKKRIEEDTKPIKLPLREDGSGHKFGDVGIRRNINKKSVKDIREEYQAKINVTMRDEEIDEAIDDSFDKLFRDEENGELVDEVEQKYEVSEAELARDKEESRNLFGQIAVNYIRPLKQFMFELNRGSASADWIQVCVPAIESMIHSMSTMRLNEEAEVLDIFRRFLDEIKARDEKIIVGESQRVALDLYSHLEEILPETFLLGEEGVQKEGIIIFSLMKQIPEVGKVTLDKLIAAGLVSLEMLYLATPYDLSRTTGIPSRIAEKMCKKVLDYKKETERRPVDSELGGIQEMLGKLVNELEHQHSLYEELISSGWNDPDFNNKKKQYRKIRQEISLKINVFLAELGEFELVEEIEQLPFDRRIIKLNDYLSEANKK